LARPPADKLGKADKLGSQKLPNFMQGRRLNTLGKRSEPTK